MTSYTKEFAEALTPPKTKGDLIAFSVAIALGALFAFVIFKYIPKQQDTKNKIQK